MSDYYQKGFAAALESNCLATVLPRYLDGVDNIIYNEAKLSKDDSQNLSAQLQKDIEKRQKQKNLLDKRINSLNRSLTAKEKVLESIQAQRLTFMDDSTRTGESDQFLSFAIGSTITFLLTLYLLLFYSSTGLSMLYDVPTTGNGIINPSIFSIALSRGGGAIGFIFLFPVIFLAVGFAMFVALEKRNALIENKGGGAYTWVILIVGTTFIMDFIIGYKIAHGVYIRDYLNGLHDIPWSTSMVFSDINFYLVLVLGFAAYLIWGFLLNYVLTHPYRLEKPNTTTSNSNLISLQEEIIDLSEQLEKLETRAENLDKEIRFKTATNQIISEGNVPDGAKVILLQNAVDEFMKGYLSYAENALSHSTDYSAKLAQIKTVKERWIATKTEILHN